MGEQEAGEQRRERRSGQRERTLEAAAGERHDAGAHAGDHEGLDRPERPPPGGDRSAADHVLQGLARRTDRGGKGGQHHGDQRQQQRSREARTGLEGRLARQHAAHDRPAGQGHQRPREHADEEGGKELEEQQGCRPGRPATAQSRHGDLPATRRGRRREHEPQHEDGQHRHRCQQQRHGPVGLGDLRPQVVGQLVDPGAELEVRPAQVHGAGDLLDPLPQRHQGVDVAVRGAHGGAGL